MTVNLDENERRKFAALARDWWDPNGPSRTLHDINPSRLAYISASRSLTGAAIADIGCGGGILSAAMARAGASVIAIDATPELVSVAKQHAEDQQLAIDYRCQLSAQLATNEAAQYDLVTCMELLEHVPDVDALVSDCARLLKPGGQLIVSTLNRTPLAYAFGVIAAEYVLGLVPKGTHDYQNFLRPSELVSCAARHQLAVTDISGMSYNPLTRSATIGGAPTINYLARFCKEPNPLA